MGSCSSAGEGGCCSCSLVRWGKGGGFGVVCADNGVLLVWVLALDDGGCWVGEAGGGGAGKVKVEAFLT